jgi:hypothetical protein
MIQCTAKSPGANKHPISTGNDPHFTAGVLFFLAAERILGPILHGSRCIPHLCVGGLYACTSASRNLDLAAAASVRPRRRNAASGDLRLLPFVLGEPICPRWHTKRCVKHDQFLAADDIRRRMESDTDACRQRESCAALYRRFGVIILTASAKAAGCFSERSHNVLIQLGLYATFLQRWIAPTWPMACCSTDTVVLWVAAGSQPRSTPGRVRRMLSTKHWGVP